MDIRKKTLNNDVCYQTLSLTSHNCLDLYTLCINIKSDAPLSNVSKQLHKGTINITIQV